MCGIAGSWGGERHFDPQGLELLTQEFERIRKVWLDNLRAQPSPVAAGQAQQIEDEIASGIDLASLWLSSISDDTFDIDAACQRLIHKLRKETYSIGNLYEEICCLKRACYEQTFWRSDSFEKDHLVPIFHFLDFLDYVFYACLTETSVIYETVLEKSKRAFSYVSAGGDILYGNAAFQRLVEPENFSGRQLGDFLPGCVQAIGDAVKVPADQTQPCTEIEPVITRTYLKAGDQDIPVTAEIGALVVNGVSKGAYAIAADISPFVEAERRVYDESKIAIIEVDTTTNIIYANNKAGKILGYSSPDKLKSKRFVSLFEEREKKIIEQHILARRKGKSTEYKVDYHRADDGRTLPLRIIGIPRVDTKGEWTSTFAIIKALDVDTARERLDKANVATATLDQLLTDTIKAIQDLIFPFEAALVGVFNKTGHHLRLIYLYPHLKQPWGTIWFPVTDEQKAWLKQEKPIIIKDIGAFMQDKLCAEYLEGDARIKAFFDSYKHMAVFPVRQYDELVATVAFCRKERVFRKGEYERLTQLRVEQIVKDCLSILERQENEFIQNLGRVIAESTGSAAPFQGNASEGFGPTQKMATIICEELTKHYAWHNVSIFSVTTDKFRLLAQNAEPRHGYRLPEIHEQGISRGLLGEACRTGKPLFEGDVHNGPLRGLYLETCPETQSELVFPIQLMGRVAWLINIEDKRKSAFCDEDVQTLRKIVIGLKAVLEGVLARTELGHVWDVASDGILMTDWDWQIIEANASVGKLLRTPPKQLEGRQFIEEFIEKREIARAIKESAGRTSRLLNLRISDALSPPVELYTAPLPEYGRRVIFLKDLSVLMQLINLEAFSTGLYEIAAQTRLPLSLGTSLLSKLVASRDPETVDIVGRALRQLAKAERTFERIALYGNASEQLPASYAAISLRVFFDDVFKAFARQDREALELQASDDIEVFWGDRYQLEFVLQSILDYLLRQRPPSGKVKIQVEADKDFVTFRIRGVVEAALEEARTGSIPDLAMTARAAVALGEKFLRQFVDNHKGTYRRERQGRKVVFTVRLPRVGGDTGPDNFSFAG